MIKKEIYGIIYRAFLEDGRGYIGQTIKTINKRIREHKCNSKNVNDARHFYNAIRKYGFNNFKWEILEECYSEEKLNLGEEQWINYFDYKNRDKGFNLQDAGFRKRHHPDTIEKIKQSKLGDKNPMFGKHGWSRGKELTKDHKKKIIYIP